MGGQVLEYEAKAILNKGKTEARNEDIKVLAEYFVKETPRLSYDDAVAKGLSENYEQEKYCHK